MGGFERYFQIARCYRDEGSKPDRQPEFTQVCIMITILLLLPKKKTRLMLILIFLYSFQQLDIELRDTSTEEVQRLIEGLMHHIWPAGLGTLTLPFPEMTYKEAMAKYGVDKPDTRFENLVIHSITNLSCISSSNYNLIPSISAARFNRTREDDGNVAPLSHFAIGRFRCHGCRVQQFCGKPTTDFLLYLREKKKGKTFINYFEVRLLKKRLIEFYDFFFGPFTLV